MPVQQRQLGGPAVNSVARGQTEDSSGHPCAPVEVGGGRPWGSIPLDPSLCSRGCAGLGIWVLSEIICGNSC